MSDVLDMRHYAALERVTMNELRDHFDFKVFAAWELVGGERVEIVRDSDSRVDLVLAVINLRGHLGDAPLKLTDDDAALTVAITTAWRRGNMIDEMIDAGDV